MKKVLTVLGSLFFLLSSTDIRSQMFSLVDSPADDEFAHAYDFLATPQIDESMDGTCEDSLHRCTLRAAIEEASILGQWANILIQTNGLINIDPLQGGFYLPDHSIVTATGFSPVIQGNLNDVIFGIGNNTTIDGLILNNGLYGIFIAGNDNLIGSALSDDKNHITNMEEAGIYIAGDNNLIINNWIGLNETGMVAGSQKFGIFISGKNNTIGGSNVDQANVISGNDIGIGVYTFDTLGVSKNYIKGNFIGTDPTGTQTRPNRVGIDNIGPGLAIGGTTAPETNVISGNTESGILLGVLAGYDVFIGGNHIGVDINGNLPIPNRDGITLGPGTFNAVVENNLIARNSQNGILISGIPDPILRADFNIVRGNTIFRNDNAGILITGAAGNNIIGSSLTQDYSPNEIESNGASGVLIAASLDNPERNTIRKNKFQDNGFFGIQIAAGQGNIQPPVLTSYEDFGQGFATVTGTHPLAGAVIDFYEGIANQLHNYEGVDWLGNGTVDASGHFSVIVPTCFCDTIVATATDIIGNTSEFSEGLEVIITSIDEPVSVLKDVKITPNPFLSEVIIHFNLKKAENIVLSIYDMTGKEVETIIKDHLQKGEHQFSWKPEGQSSGMYYYRFVIDSYAANAGKLIFMNN